MGNHASSHNHSLPNAPGGTTLAVIVILITLVFAIAMGLWVWLAPPETSVSRPQNINDPFAYLDDGPLEVAVEVRFEKQADFDNAMQNLPGQSLTQACRTLQVDPQKVLDAVNETRRPHFIVGLPITGPKVGRIDLYIQNDQVDQAEFIDYTSNALTPSAAQPSTSSSSQPNTQPGS